GPPQREPRRHHVRAPSFLRTRNEVAAVQQLRRSIPSFHASTISARLRVEFPRPAALLQNIYAIHQLRSPALVFSKPARPEGDNSSGTASAPKILHLTLRKSFSVGLGSGDHSLWVARDRWAQKEKRKCTAITLNSLASSAAMPKRKPH